MPSQQTHEDTKALSSAKVKYRRERCCWVLRCFFAVRLYLDTGDATFLIELDSEEPKPLSEEQEQILDLLSKPQFAQLQKRLRQLAETPNDNRATTRQPFHRLFPKLDGCKDSWVSNYMLVLSKWEPIKREVSPSGLEIVRLRLAPESSGTQSSFAQLARRTFYADKGSIAKKYHRAIDRIGMLLFEKRVGNCEPNANNEP